MKQLMLIAIRNLLQNRRRTMLLSSAIGMVSALLVVLLGLTGSMRDAMFQSATTLMTGHINIGGFYKITSSQVSATVTDYQPLLNLVQQEVPELDFIVTRGRGVLSKITSDTSNIEAGLVGIYVVKDRQFSNGVDIESGTLAELTAPNTILLFAEQAKKLDVNVGDTVTISTTTTRGTSNSADVRVCAIAHDIGFVSGLNVFLGEETLRDLIRLDDRHTGALHLYLKNARDVGPVLARLRERLATLGYQVLTPDAKPFFFKFQKIQREDWTGQKLDVTSWEEEMSFVSWTHAIANALSISLVAILLVIISIGIMNTMWIVIRERTREIGTLRAIGMQRSNVMLMFLFEAAFLGILGTFSGLLLGGVLTLVINSMALPVPTGAAGMLMTKSVHISLELETIFYCLAGISAVTAFAALYPSHKAARLEPVTAMQHVGDRS